MTEITTVRVEDVYPRPNARQLDGTLVKQITQSISLIGFSPADPVVVRRDGDIYWIVDGGHRTAAAKAAGLTEIPAVVEDLDDAGVLTYEGALNLQRPDTEEERWARAQQFFALGESAIPAEIALATGIDQDRQARVRRVITRLNDPVAAEDVTLEQALKAHEFLDDEDAFKAIMNAGAKWSQVYYRFDSSRKQAALIEHARGIIEAAGAELVQETTDAMHYLTGGDTAPEGAKWATVRAYSSSYCQISWYGDADVEADKEAAAQREAEAERRAELDHAALRRLEFLTEHLTERKYALHPALVELACAMWEDESVADVSDIPESLTGLAGYPGRFYAALLGDMERLAANIIGGHIGGNYYAKNSAPDIVAYYDALAASGYEPTEVETARLAYISALIEPQDEPDEEADDDDA